MWPFEEELEEWFAEVRLNREYDGPSRGDSDEPGLVRNEYADQFKN